MAKLSGKCETPCFLMEVVAWVCPAGSSLAMGPLVAQPRTKECLFHVYPNHCWLLWFDSRIYVCVYIYIYWFIYIYIYHPFVNPLISPSSPWFLPKNAPGLMSWQSLQQFWVSTPLAMVLSQAPCPLWPGRLLGIHSSHLLVNHLEFRMEIQHV